MEKHCETCYCAPPRIDPADVVERVANVWGVTVHEMLGRGRDREIVSARRQVARELRAKSFLNKEIGLALNRNQSTISHLLKRRP